MRISDWSSDVCSSDLGRSASSSDRRRRDRQRRVGVGMIEELEDDRGGEGRGHGFLAEHVEQGVFSQVEVHDFDREKIGRASCREKSVSVSVDHGGSRRSKKKKAKRTRKEKKGKK